MGARTLSTSGMDLMLFLYLERSEMGRKGMCGALHNK